MSPSNDPGEDPTAVGKPEAAYCGSSINTYSPSYTISGKATYEARQLTANGLGNAGTPKPIRYAEVNVINSSGTLVQCTETDTNGKFSFQLPQDDGTYTVFVNSRANNTHLKASVLDVPSTKNYYSLSMTFTADSNNKDIGTLNAPVTGAILGGAFNIYDQLLNANEFLATQVGNCPGGYSCTAFTVASKVEAYWKKGVNPATYIGGSSTSGLSFYLPGYSRLFILGGINGDTDHLDTDHFDNSVIIHEYGHFLEDSVFRSSSPGGSHTGNKIIDPRLAWSEGWGNFFQAAVQDSPYYIDTYGNIDGGAGNYGYYFKVNLEDVSSGYDEPIQTREGTFREFSVTRFLWDMLDHVSDGSPAETVEDAFPDIWAVLTRTTNGFKDTDFPFLNIGAFHQFQQLLEANDGGKDLSAIRNLEKQEPAANRDYYYAQYIKDTGSACTYTLTPAYVNDDNGSFSTSDLNQNNDFFHLNIPSDQSVILTFTYEDDDNAGTEADADLYLYNKNARFGYDSDVAAYSWQENDGNPTTAETETISTTLSAGDYLINVFIYTGKDENPPYGTREIGEKFNYTLKLNGSPLCP